jgi:type III secretion protein Q
MIMLTSVAPRAPRSATSDAFPAAVRDSDWLPAIAAVDVALLNALYRHRRPLEAQVAGYNVAIQTVARAAAESNDHTFRLSLSGRRAFMRVTAKLVDACAQSLDVTGFDRLGPRQAALVLEVALLQSIKAIEAKLRADIRIEERIETADSDDTLVPLHFRVVGGADIYGIVELSIDRKSVGAVAAALDGTAAPNGAMDRLPIPVRLCRAGLDLPLAELRTLRPGDVILPDSHAKQQGAAIAVIGEHVPFETERVATGFRLAARLSRSRVDSAGEWFMQQPTDVLQRPSDDTAGLEQLPVRVVFEIGRLELPLADIRRLAPGYVLPLTKPVESAVDIMANGRKIGQGSLLKVGDSIGVRVERLFSDD